MSPEQVRGQDISTAADVFSLGSVLAYAATGRTPFGDGDSGIHALLFRIAYEEPDLTGIPESVADLVADCLAKDPAARPSTTQIAERTRIAPAGAWLPPSLLARVDRFAAQPVPATATREEIRPAPRPEVSAVRVSAPSAPSAPPTTPAPSATSASWAQESEAGAVLHSSPPTVDEVRVAPPAVRVAVVHRPTPTRRPRRRIATTLLGFAALAAAGFGFWFGIDSLWKARTAPTGSNANFSGSWVTEHSKNVPLFVLRLDVPESWAPTYRVDVMTATGDALCRGSAVATYESATRLKVSEFALSEVGSGPARSCGEPDSMHLSSEPDNTYGAIGSGRTADHLHRRGPRFRRRDR
ncbi:hypothetical protein GCM10010329_45730 [Streptomyces spiroverticillatus]|uniref:non-specific serine/threonine protein kinase n=1 Tax=Streptomyces finlayi TaxID=67296 RepID=A0A918X012_9ACTN|nr:protein kinase [Streptomyces finlayi]GHA17518.1 hypothetical protein GCM10010329_45730 [Streptomyces spiroverticillatus]GHC99400.1 hypothetical protein GCM10010334_42900 [Streptomyces finlayi]